MEISKDFELVSEISFALSDCPPKDNVICLCTRVWCSDYQKYIKGIKGKKINIGNSNTLFFDFKIVKLT